MSRDGAALRLSVLLAFAALAALAAAAVRRAPVAGLAPAELREREERMVAMARLHPAEAAPAPPGSAPFCTECHPAPAHAGNGIAPAMHNAHAASVDCLFCHWTDAAGPRPAASWRPWTPPGKGAGKREFLTPWAPGETKREDLARIRGVVTASRKCFVRGPSCAECHRPGGIAPWARPGAPAGRAASLERLEDWFRLPPGEKWYFPPAR